MSFDAPVSGTTRVAVIGGGISGMMAALKLAEHHAVTLFEAEPRLGGHARTVLAGRHGTQPVDTGFIVFNYVNYPHLTRLFHDLDVPVEKSDMSFGATIDNGRIEYGLRNVGALLGQRRNLLRPGFAGMVRDILRFNTHAEAVAETGGLTIEELMQELRLGEWFRNYYLLPISGAIWSTPVEEVANYPAQSLVRFFRNHALLSTTGQHQWWTVKGGSIEYVRRLEARLRLLGVEIRTGAPVASVGRDSVGVQIRSVGAPAQDFDQVVFACHSDQALRLLEKPTPAERAALGDLTYQDNRVILHRDPNQMPKCRACWSSWVYRADTMRDSTAIGVTYWMNRLQNIPESDPLFVSLNPAHEIPEALIYDEATFSHPVFDAAALRAQQAMARIQGMNKTWYAGAYLRYGFHEDGAASAVRIARMMERIPA